MSMQEVGVIGGLVSPYPRPIMLPLTCVILVLAAIRRLPQPWPAVDYAHTHHHLHPPPPAHRQLVTEG